MRSIASLSRASRSERLCWSNAMTKAITLPASARALKGERDAAAEVGLTLSRHAAHRDRRGADERAERRDDLELLGPTDLVDLGRDEQDLGRGTAAGARGVRDEIDERVVFLLHAATRVDEEDERDELPALLHVRLD